MPASELRPRVGVVKLTSCDGCQLTILDLEEELLAITERFDIIDFHPVDVSGEPGTHFQALTLRRAADR